MQGLGRSLGGGGEPFVADQQHRLSEVQGQKARVERHRQHRVGQGQIVVQEAGTLRPEQDAAGFVRGDAGAHFARRLARRHLAPDHAAVARGGGIDMDEIGDRRRDRRVEPGLVEHRVGAARRGNRPLGRPAVARPHQPQIVERAVHHRPRRGADILAELRLDQDDRRPPRRRPAAMIGPGHLVWSALEHHSDGVEPILPGRRVGGPAVGHCLYIAQNSRQFAPASGPFIISFQEPGHRLKGLLSG